MSSSGKPPQWPDRRTASANPPRGLAAPAHAFVSARTLAPSKAARRRLIRHGDAAPLVRGGYAVGAPSLPSAVSEALALRAAVDGVAIDWLAGLVMGLDSVGPEPSVPAVAVAPGASGRRAGVRRLALDEADVVLVDGIPCTSPALTLAALARRGPIACEQALESALRLGLTEMFELEAVLPVLGRRRVANVGILRDVVADRPPGAAPTESLLETLFVQLARDISGLGPPVRQLVLHQSDGRVIARVDIAWPELGLFIELDGQHHRGQPVYDADRETAVVAATGWLVGRFTWDDVVRRPRVTARRVAALVDQARRRPLP